MTDNGTHFIDGKFQILMEVLRIRKHFSSVKHPQTNGQAESTNRMMVRGLKKRIEEAKVNWVDELPHVPWAYQTTPQSITGGIAYRLTYMVEAIILVGIKELAWRITNPLHSETNDATL